MRAIEPGYLLLVVGFMALVAVNLSLSRDRAQLVRAIRDSRPGMAGALAPEPGDLLPSFSTVTLDGAHAGLHYDGSHRYLLFMFSRQCAVSVGQAQTWAEIADQARGKVTVRWLSVDDDDSPSTWSPHPEEVLKIPSRAVLRAYRINALPQVYVVSPTGQIEWVHIGSLNATALDELRRRVSMP